MHVRADSWAPIYFPVLAASLIFSLGCVAPWSGFADPSSGAETSQRKALVLGRGDPYREPDGGPTHPQGAKTAFLKLAGNPDNDPARGWTCDLSWDLMARLGLDPAKTEPETLFKYIGAHRLGYRVVIQNGPHGHVASFWDCALDNGMMPFAPQGNNVPGQRIDDPPGLGAAVSVAGGSTINTSSYGPGVEFIDAMPKWLTHESYEDAAQSWANQYTAAKFAHILDANPRYNIWDARQHLRQAGSFWSAGWNETNGYGRVSEQAQIGQLLPGPPLSFQASLARDRHQVLFTWRNFLQSDFAATVIARKDGRVVYEGTGTQAVWVPDHDGEERFAYWSRNRAGATSRLETYQTRSVTGLKAGAYQTCLVLGAPKGDEALNHRLQARFLAVATNWVCEIAWRSSNPVEDRLAASLDTLALIALPDVPSMVHYALSNHYRILIPTVSPTERDLYRFRSIWDEASAAGALVVVPHNASIAKARVPQARRLSPPRLSSALTVGEGSITNARSFGPGLECFDTASGRSTDSFEASQLDAAAVVAGKLALILDTHPGYNNWDARQHLRQSSSFYATGWVEDGGYGRPPAEPAKIHVLDPAPPLEIQAQKSVDGKSVSFSWENFLQTSFAETVIARHDGRILYHGTGTAFVWTSDVDGDETFKFFSKDRAGRLSKSESYTVLSIAGLKAD